VEIRLTHYQQLCYREIFSYSDDKACVGQQKHGGLVVRIARHDARITYPLMRLAFSTGFMFVK
jgi:hypothetical protein